MAPIEKNKELKVKTGIVTSNKMIDTIVVSILNKVKHKKYGKITKKTIKFYVHAPKNTCNIGDTIQFVESVPFSKKKAFRLINTDIKKSIGN